MDPSSRFQVLYFLLFVVVVSGATNRPGLQLQLSQKGLDTAAGVAIDQLSGKLQGQHIDDQHGKTHAGGGKVEYYFKNMVIRSFTKPTSHVTVTPTSGLTWAASGAGISVHGDWRYKYRKHFIHFSDSGSFHLSASGIDFRISVKMGVDKSGRPTIYTTGCSSNVAHLKVKFHGGASWLYNLFDDQISKVLKSKLQDLMCQAAKISINVDAAKKLAELEVVTKVGKQMTLDYRLTQAPVFGNGFIQTMHKGEISWSSAPKPFPADPAAFPSVSNTSSMVYIMASEYVVNSYAYAAFTHGLARYNLSAEKMPKGKEGFLNTTCHTFGTACIGNFLYKVAKKYPNSSVMIDMETTKAPFVRVFPKGVNLTFTGEMTFKAKTPKAEIVYLFKMALEVNMSLTAMLENHTVKADVSAFTPRVKVLDTAVGPISNANMQYIFQAASRNFIIKKLKELGNKGIDVPNIHNIQYVKPSLRLAQGSLVIASDVIWNPKLFKHFTTDSFLNNIQPFKP